jgi:hypothetical protein
LFFKLLAKCRFDHSEHLQEPAMNGMTTRTGCQGWL